MIEAGVNVPIAVLGAEIDQVSPPELVRQFEDILASKPEVLCFAQVDSFHFQLAPIFTT